MLQRIRNRQGGFTLIELLIVVAIIGIIAAILIPNLLDAIQKSKQKATMSDMRNIGTAMTSWMTDIISASAAGRTGAQTITLPDAVTFTELETILVSPANANQSYLQELTQTDGWGCDYTFFVNGGADATAAELQGGGTGILAIASGGQPADGTCDAPTSGSITRATFIATDYQQDIVWADGFFVTRPSGLGGS